MARILDLNFGDLKSTVNGGFLLCGKSIRFVENKKMMIYCRVQHQFSLGPARNIDFLKLHNLERVLCRKKQKNESNYLD
jgi:hypothetical protein